ncbi:MAG: hypothetical protein ABTA23_03610 [Solibacillus sp.]
MTIYDLIDDDTRDKLNAVHRPSNKHKREHERLSEYDIRELMGMNRDRYRKVNGKVKRK